MFETMGVLQEHIVYQYGNVRVMVTFTFTNDGDCKKAFVTANQPDIPGEDSLVDVFYGPSAVEMAYKRLEELSEAIEYDDENLFDSRHCKLARMVG